MTREQKNEAQRLYRLNNKNACTAKYEKTKSGFLVRLYRNMQSRVEGVQKAKHHLYEGKELLDRKSFYNWANSSPEFASLFEVWEASGYERRLTPSVDRVDSSLGYSLGNMEWVTHSVNSSRGSISRYKGANSEQEKRVA